MGRFLKYPEEERACLSKYWINIFSLTVRSSAWRFFFLGWAAGKGGGGIFSVKITEHVVN